MPYHTTDSLKCAIIRTSSLGDVVIASSCLNIIHNFDKNAKVFWVGSSPSLDLLSTSYPQVIPIPIQKSRAYFGVSKSDLKKLSGLDFVVDLQMNTRSKWLCNYIQIKYGTPVFKLPKSRAKRLWWVLSSKFRSRRTVPDFLTSQNHHKQYQNNNSILLKALKNTKGIEASEATKNTNSFLPISTNDFSYSSTLKQVRWIAIGLGAGYAPKRAPLELFVKIIDQIHLSLSGKKANFNDYGLLFLGDKVDRELGLKAAEKIQWHGHRVNLAGQLSLKESAQALKMSKVLICNDSLLLHLSEAVQTPVASLFGPTIEGFGFGPQLHQSKSFSAKLGCRPCSKHGKKPCRYKDYKCFNSIDAQEVTNFILGQLFAN